MHWDAQVIVEHFNNLNYVELIRSTRQEVKLSGKSAFGIWSANFAVKVHRCYAENGRFSEQPFGSSVENSNQKISFCGIGSHHQNSFVESKIQTLTPRAK